jgi:hypothetical protein
MKDTITEQDIIRLKAIKDCIREVVDLGEKFIVALDGYKGFVTEDDDRLSEYAFSSDQEFKDLHNRTQVIWLNLEDND